VATDLRVSDEHGVSLKALAEAEGVVGSQVLVDGNKRLDLLAMLAFLPGTSRSDFAHTGPTALSNRPTGQAP
jgi:hypothetical protein